MPDLDLSKLAVQLDAALDDLRAGKGDPLASIEAVSAALAGTQTVWIANVEHSHGSDTGVFNTQRGAQLSLVQWADKYWDEEIGTSLDRPTDDDERMEAYFAWMQDHNRGEYYGIECLPVQHEPMEVITEAAEIDDTCEGCADNADAPDCDHCGASNAGSREHPHLCEVCAPLPRTPVV